MTTRRVGIVKDTSKPMLGLHGLHVAFRGLPGVEVVGLVDANPENLDEKLARPGAARHYDALNQRRGAGRLDIAVRCARHAGDHLGEIEAAARHGVHVSCEKPISTSLVEADRIVELVEQHDIKLCMAHPARYAPAFRTMARMIGAGDIGTPLTAWGRGKCDHRGGGEDLIVLGTHVLDTMVHLFGPPEHVWADVQTDGRPIEQTDRTETVEPLGPVAGDSILAHFGFDGGVRGVFESRRGISDPASGNIYVGLAVHGSRGSLTMRLNDGQFEAYTPRLSRKPAPPEDAGPYTVVPSDGMPVIDGAEPLDYQLCGSPDVPRGPMFPEANRLAALDLLGAIEEDRLPVSNVYNARTVVEMIHGIYASHLSGRRISFPLDDRRHPLEHA